MKENSRKAVILNRLSSPYISEAIIILKDDLPYAQSFAVEEAERIVSAYLERTQKGGQPDKGAARRHSWKLTAFLCLLAASIAFFVGFVCFH